MRDRSTITDFVLAFREKWLAAMTGGLSAPFAALAAWADNQYAKLTFAALAFAGVWSAAYQVWKVERERVVSLERQLADRATKEQILNALDNLIEQTKSFWRRRVASDVELAEYAAQFDAFDASLRSMLSPLLSSAEIGALNAPTSSPLTFSHAFNTRHNQYLVRVEMLLQRLSRLVERYS